MRVIFALGGGTVDLPPAPPTGAKVIVKDNGSGGGHTINGNGVDIEGSPSIIMPFVAYTSVTLIYNVFAGKWLKTAEI